MKLEKILDNLNSFEKNSFLKIIDSILGKYRETDHPYAAEIDQGVAAETDHPNNGKLTRAKRPKKAVKF